MLVDKSVDRKLNNGWMKVLAGCAQNHTEVFHLPFNTL